MPGGEIVTDTQVLREAAIKDVRAAAEEAAKVKSYIPKAASEDTLVARVIKAVKLGFAAKSIRGQIKGGESDAI